MSSHLDVDGCVICRIVDKKMPDRKTASHDKENQITSKSPHDSDNSGLFGEDALVADFQALKPSSTNALESRWSSRSSLFVEERCRMTLSWEDLNVFIKDEANSRKRSTFRLFSCLKRKEIARPKQILKNVTGLAEPGQLLAIMGSRYIFGSRLVLFILHFQWRRKDHAFECSDVSKFK